MSETSLTCITISQPYASYIASGEKWVENRSWATLYRGWIGIHAGKGTQYLTRKQLASYPTGSIIAVAQLVDCLRLVEFGIEPTNRKLSCGITVAEFLGHQHTEGPWCWILRNVRSIDPIQRRGQQGLWTTRCEVQRL